jgi:hypothetical protein
MSENKSILSAENVPTVAAVALVLGLISIAYGFYVHRQVWEAAVGASALDVRAAKRDIEINKQIDDLKKRVDALEAAQKATAAAPMTDATSGAAAEPAAPAK